MPSAAASCRLQYSESLYSLVCAGLAVGLLSRLYAQGINDVALRAVPPGQPQLQAPRGVDDAQGTGAQDAGGRRLLPLPVRRDPLLSGARAVARPEKIKVSDPPSWGDLRY
ncbi:hypothetical protein E6A55_29465 [Cupriavidus necator H16]|uniref:Uncharacterized protein n=1 Tax=Cupriavidus necator (strain ATCC 17699 / DSM 428 / KCTC 22496 / NCIMB 10442 / H16 / Stanier 337) TaxID=381666 RepID=A0AAE5ZJU0_CUPNH|nr:hypothetical protein [Cupriavidus necator]QCC04620.1 hypothetical protein E6A55_29465 [Cupriavidus necator H16]QQB79311.1 hypothetical protein I6H87_29030 [Cupriavidus necator]WKA43539.1 hypothetical protein QWP09_29505 [Cupriavidus necator]